MESNAKILPGRLGFSNFHLTGKQRYNNEILRIIKNNSSKSKLIKTKNARAPLKDCKNHERPLFNVCSLPIEKRNKKKSTNASDQNLQNLQLFKFCKNRKQSKMGYFLYIEKRKNPTARINLLICCFLNIVHFNNFFKQ